MTTTTCIAYNADGFICHRPAPYLDSQRGGYVCEEHVPYLVESPYVHGRYLVAGHELTSGDRIALDVGGQGPRRSRCAPACRLIDQEGDHA